MAFANAADLDTIAGDGIRTLGPAFARTLRDQQSLNRFEQALEKYRQARDRRGEAYTLNNLGAYYAELKGNLTRAREFYEEALPIWREIGDRRGEGLTAFNLSVNAARAGYWEESIQWLIDSLEMRCQVGDRWGERRTRTTLGKFLCQQGLYDQVLEQYDQALAISREIGDRRGELVTLGLLGTYYRDLGEFDQAGKFYNQVLESWENLDQVQDQAEFLLNLGLLLHQKGEDQEGLERCQEGQELILGGDYLELEWMGLTVQGNCFAALGMLKEAEVAYKKASSKAQKWRRLVLGYEASAGFARVMMAKGKKEKALLGIEKLLSHLQNDPPAGPRSPLDGALEATRIYLTCNQVLQANRDGRAKGILMRAYDLVQSRAGTIESLELRASYLDNVPANRQIVAETAS